MIAPLLDSTRECDAIACTHAPLYNIISALRTLDIRSILPFPLSPFPATYLTLFRAGYNEAVEMTSEVTVTKILALGRNGGVKNHLVGTKRKREKIEEILPVITPKYKLIVSTRLQSRKGKGDADVPENPWAPISGPQYLPYEKIEESHG